MELRYPDQIRQGVALVWHCDNCGEENTVNRVLKKTHCKGCGEEYFVTLHVYHFVQKKKEEG